MTRTIFRDVRVFDPGSGVDRVGVDVFVDGETIVGVEPTGSARTPGDREIAGRGRLLCPGLIDLRVHLCQPGSTDRETVATGSAAAAAGGFTTIVAMPDTTPAIDSVEVVDTVLARAREAGSVRVLCAGAMSVGRDGERLAELAKLASAGCCMFTDVDRPVRDSQLLRYALETGIDVGTVIATHPEDPYLSRGGVMHEGVVSARLGLEGIPETAEVVGVARDLALAELTGARLHLHHISTAGAVELIRQAKRRNARVTAEVSPCHLRLTDAALAAYDPLAKLSPPLRTTADVQAVVEGLADGTVDVVASDHTPRTFLEKNVELDRAASGAIGLESSLGLMLTLVSEGRLTLERAVRAMTSQPAAVLNRPDLGKIEVGGPADLVLVDPDHVWTFMESDVRSRSRNSPLFGQTFRGRGVLTMSRGRVTYEWSDDDDRP